MSSLTPREQELVSLAAAMGCNCVSCIEHHIPVSRKAGLSDEQISEAVRLADKVRQVPARRTLDRALDLISESTPVADAHAPCCGS
jgi:AhpD family alkylhydroperoxidase